MSQAAQKSLWASVYASAYQHLCARAAACYKPEPFDRPDPRYGIATVGAHEYAVQEADRAVQEFLSPRSTLS
jgi:hypothetical protein